MTGRASWKSSALDVVETGTCDELRAEVRIHKRISDMRMDLIEQMASENVKLKQLLAEREGTIK